MKTMQTMNQSHRHRRKTYGLKEQMFALGLALAMSWLPAEAQSKEATQSKPSNSAQLSSTGFELDLTESVRELMNSAVDLIQREPKGDNSRLYFQAIAATIETCVYVTGNEFDIIFDSPLFGPEQKKRSEDLFGQYMGAHRDILALRESKNPKLRGDPNEKMSQLVNIAIADYENMKKVVQKYQYGSKQEKTLYSRAVSDCKVLADPQNKAYAKFFKGLLY